jgi:hypothetical protein
LRLGQSDWNELNPLPHNPNIAAIATTMHGEPDVVQFELRINKSKGLIPEAIHRSNYV